MPVIIVLAAILLIILPTKTQQHPEAHLTDKTDAQRTRLAILLLFVLFVTYGLSDFSLKSTQYSVESRFEGNAMDLRLSSLAAAIFLFASIFSLVFCFIRKSFRNFGWKAVAGGLALGLVNSLCTSCSLRALSVMSTSLYYPVYNIGIVVISTLAGVIFFKEKIKWIQLAGLALAALGIVLLFVY